MPQEDPVPEQVQETPRPLAAPVGRMSERERALELAVPLGDEVQSPFRLAQSTLGV